MLSENKDTINLISYSTSNSSNFNENYYKFIKL